MKTLADFREEYKWICYSILTEQQKVIMLESLISELNQVFKIPFVKNEEWETKNQAVNALFYEISTAKSTLEKLV